MFVRTPAAGSVKSLRLCQRPVQAEGFSHHLRLWNELQQPAFNGPEEVAMAAVTIKSSEHYEKALDRIDELVRDIEDSDGDRELIDLLLAVAVWEAEHGLPPRKIDAK